jgi:hypothetical protein
VRKALLLFIPIVLLCLNLSYGQAIVISGRAIDIQYPQIALQQVMAINLETQQGVFGADGNSFEITVNKNDSIVVTATGYAPTKFCMKDSIYKPNYKVVIALKRLSVNLDEITVRRKRELEQINNDIQKLGYNKSDYRLTSIEAWQSPITSIYQAFSKKERNKRKLAEMINRDNRNSLIKELLDLYQRSDLIELPREKYDEFITYLRLDDETLKLTSDYDLALYIRDRYIEYTNR